MLNEVHDLIKRVNECHAQHANFSTAKKSSDNIKWRLASISHRLVEWKQTNACESRVVCDALLNLMFQNKWLMMRDLLEAEFLSDRLAEDLNHPQQLALSLQPILRIYNYCIGHMTQPTESQNYKLWEWILERNIHLRVNRFLVNLITDWKHAREYIELQATEENDFSFHMEVDVPHTSQKRWMKLPPEHISGLTHYCKLITNMWDNTNYFWNYTLQAEEILALDQPLNFLCDWLQFWFQTWHYRESNCQSDLYFPKPWFSVFQDGEKLGQFLECMIGTPEIANHEQFLPWLFEFCIQYKITNHVTSLDPFQPILWKITDQNLNHLVHLENSPEPLDDVRLPLMLVRNLHFEETRNVDWDAYALRIGLNIVKIAKDAATAISYLDKLLVVWSAFPNVVSHILEALIWRVRYFRANKIRHLVYFSTNILFIQQIVEFLKKKMMVHNKSFSRDDLVSLVEHCNRELTHVSFLQVHECFCKELFPGWLQSIQKEHTLQLQMHVPAPPAEVGGCSICYNDDDEKTNVLTNCGHVFHQACLYAWFEKGSNNTCPMCRTVCQCICL